MEHALCWKGKMMKLNERFFWSLLALLLFGCSINRPPSDADVSQALQAEYGKLVRVEHVRRINGIDYPGGNGAPQRYAIEYEATLIPSGPVTFRVSSAIESAFTGQAKNGVRIKGIIPGHQPD